MSPNKALLPLSAEHGLTALSPTWCLLNGAGTGGVVWVTQVGGVTGTQHCYCGSGRSWRCSPEGWVWPLISEKKFSPESTLLQVSMLGWEHLPPALFLFHAISWEDWDSHIKRPPPGAIRGAVWDKDGIYSQHSLHIQTNGGVRCRPLTFDSERCSFNVGSSSHGVTKKINKWKQLRWCENLSTICPIFVNQENTLNTASVPSCLLEMNHRPDGGTG